MRNLANSQYFEISALPFDIEGVTMYFGNTEFESLNHTNSSELKTDFYDEKEIKVRYSVHLDGNEPYVKFKIKYQKSTRTVVGEKIK